MSKKNIILIAVIILLLLVYLRHRSNNSISNTKSAIIDVVTPINAQGSSVGIIGVTESPEVIGYSM